MVFFIFLLACGKRLVNGGERRGQYRSRKIQKNERSNANENA